MGITPLQIEQTIVGDGYSGTVDLRGQLPDGGLVLVDWKSTSSVPKDKPWEDHPVQVGAYAIAWLKSVGLQDKPVRCFIGYISTKEPGLFKAFEVEDWVAAYYQEFVPSLSIWCRRKGYDPRTR